MTSNREAFYRPKHRKTCFQPSNLPLRVHRKCVLIFIFCRFCVFETSSFIVSRWCVHGFSRFFSDFSLGAFSCGPCSERRRCAILRAGFNWCCSVSKCSFLAEISVFQGARVGRCFLGFQKLLFFVSVFVSIFACFFSEFCVFVENWR